MIQIINKYSHYPKAFVGYFFNMKWPTGFYCEKCGCVHYYFLEKRNVFEYTKCGHQHYLFAVTIFQDNKLPLFKPILGLYLFFSANKGCLAVEMASQLGVNYKTALKLCRKYRILMILSNSENILDNMYYEADTIYIGAKTDDKPRNSY